MTPPVPSVPLVTMVVFIVVSVFAVGFIVDVVGEGVDRGVVVVEGTVVVVVMTVVVGVLLLQRSYVQQDVSKLSVSQICLTRNSNMISFFFR